MKKNNNSNWNHQRWWRFAQMMLILMPCSCFVLTAQALPSPEQEAFRVDDKGLYEHRNYHKGAGFQVDLKGRFSSPRTAIIGKDGKLRIGHEPLPKCDDDHDDHERDHNHDRPHDQKHNKGKRGIK